MIVAALGRVGGERERESESMRAKKKKKHMFGTRTDLRDLRIPAQAAVLVRRAH